MEDGVVVRKIHGGANLHRKDMRQEELVFLDHLCAPRHFDRGRLQPDDHTRVVAALTNRRRARIFQDDAADDATRGEWPGKQEGAKTNTPETDHSGLASAPPNQDTAFGAACLPSRTARSARCARLRSPRTAGSSRYLRFRDPRSGCSAFQRMRSV